MKTLKQMGLLLLLALMPAWALACEDAVVLVHGNAGYPSDWDNTVSELYARGYSSSPTSNCPRRPRLELGYP